MTDFSTTRQKMVDGQIRPSDVTDLRLINAMLTVPREAFVPAGCQALAYLDLDIEISVRSGDPQRYLIKPAVIAKMLQAANITQKDRVLIVGCATGYSAALAAKLASQVFATENVSALTEIAQVTLKDLGISNVTVATASPGVGDPAHAPYDVIILDGATQIVPENLYRQLAVGGRLVGVFATKTPPHAKIITHSRGDLGHRTLFDAYAPVLPGMEHPVSFIF